MLRNAGTEKITFVGGEPMLCPYIGALLVEAKRSRLSTKIVSNGTGFTKAFLNMYSEYIDQISLSIDSSMNEREKQLGRGNGRHVDIIKKVSSRLRDYEIPLQVNTTVTSLTWDEDMHELIEELQPFRWKVFQVLPIKGQNDGLVDDLLITKEKFEHFKKTHKDIKYGIFENNDLMTGSYIMLDPIGRFIDNTKGRHIYSDSIFKIGVKKAFKQITWNTKKFQERKGMYNWGSLKKDLFERKRNLISSRIIKKRLMG